MSLHDEIMRLEMQEDRYALPYANGYSDARDDAAELACKTDAEIERLEEDAERVNTYAKNLAISMHRKHFSHITQWEPLPDTIGLITQIDNMSCRTGDDVAQLTAERETIISDFLKRTGQYVTNDASREAAIAAAVAAEREEHAAEIDRLRAQVKRLRDALVGVVADDDVNSLRFTAAVLESMDCDDATGSLAAVRALIDIRPEGSAGEEKP